MIWEKSEQTGLMIRSKFKLIKHLLCFDAVLSICCC